MRPNSVLARRAVAALVAVAALAACGGAENEASADAADLVHVHGLAEADSGLYVATHTGLFQVDGDKIRAVGDATHDLMGFTAAGEGDLLASGHPDLRVDRLMVEGKPPLLGLVHSSDGKTWEPLSLLGEADFHSLKAAHGKVYGFDGTTRRFMVSEDRKTWETRAQNVIIGQFAVHPEEPDVIVASAQGVVARSSDGGRSWQKASDQQLAFIDWGSQGLFALSPAGDVLVSPDEGATWQPRGKLDGEPEALHVTEDAIYAAVTERGIFRSDDGAETFEVVVDTTG